MLFDPTLAVVPLPDLSGGNLGDFIAKLYEFSLLVVGVVVFVRFIWAGWLYFGAAGNASKTSNAKGIMTNAVIGAFLLFSAYLILYVINPDLVKSTVDLSGTTSNSAGNSGGNNSGQPPAGQGGGPQLGQLCGEDLDCPAGYICAPDQESGEFVCSYCQDDNECANWGAGYICSPTSHTCVKP